MKGGSPRSILATPGLAAFRPLVLGLTILLAVFLTSLTVCTNQPPGTHRTGNGSPANPGRKAPASSATPRKDGERVGLSSIPDATPPAPPPAGIPENRAARAGNGAADPYDVLRGSEAVPWISLTFDGDRDASDVTPILGVLAEKGVTATFFLSGDFIRDFPEETCAIVRGGHEVGNHLFRHAHLTTWEQNHRQQTRPGLQRPEFQSLLQRNEELFLRTTGAKMARLWRAPYGETNREINGWAREAGYIHISWTRDFSGNPSMDTLDWVASPDSPRYLTVGQILDRVLQFDGGVPGGAGGAIILMHTGNSGRQQRPWTILGGMIDGMRGKQYRFSSITQLVQESARVNRRYAALAEPASP